MGHGITGWVCNICSALSVHARQALGKKIKRAIRLNGGKQKCLADGRWADVESDAPPRPSSHRAPSPPPAVLVLPLHPMHLSSSASICEPCIAPRHSPLPAAVIMRQASCISYIIASVVPATGDHPLSVFRRHLAAAHRPLQRRCCWDLHSQRHARDERAALK